METLAKERDLKEHIDDDLKVNAIRDGKIVQVYWNELTEEEQRAARAVVFSLYGGE